METRGGAAETTPRWGITEAKAKIWGTEKK